MDVAPFCLSRTAQGRLVLVPDAEAPPLDAGLADRLRHSFERGAGQGLPLAGADEGGAALPPVYSYWREFGAHYASALRSQAESDGPRRVAAGARRGVWR